MGPSELNQFATLFVSGLTAWIHQREMLDQCFYPGGDVEFYASTPTLDDHLIISEFDRKPRGPMEDGPFTFFDRPIIGDGNSVGCR